MRRHVLVIVAALSGLLANIIATWADREYALSQPDHIGIILGTFLVVLCITLLLDAGVRLPRQEAYHRFWYLYRLSQSEILKRWATRFAPLHLRRSTRYIAATEVLEDGERRELVQVLTSAIRENSRTGAHILVLGEPGSGKSTAMERLTLELADASVRKLGLRGSIPVLIRATDIEAGDSLITMIKRALEKDTSGASRTVLTSSDTIQHFIDGRRLVVLFDALDELSGERRESALRALRAPVQTAGLAHISVIVTCRTRQDPGSALPNYDTYSILEMSDDAVIEFIRIYARDHQPEAVYEDLRSRGFLEVGGLGRNPFWLERLVEVDSRSPTRSGIMNMATRQALRNEVTKPAGVQREWAVPANVSPDRYIEECEYVLARLAMTMDLERTINLTDARRLVLDCMHERAPLLGVALTPEQIIELARDAGVLRVIGPVGERRVEYRHRIAQEYFAARGLHSAGLALGESLSSFITESSRWQVLAMFAGMLSPSEREKLIRDILTMDRSSRGLACAIATYVGDNNSPSPALERDLHNALRESLSLEGSIDSQLERSLHQFLAVGYDAAANFLGVMLADSQPIVRAHICYLLSASEAPEASRWLAYGGLDDRDESVAEAAITALGQLGSRAVWPAIRQLSSNLERVRRRAVRVLEKLESPEATNYLLDADVPDEQAGRALAKCSKRRVGRLLIAAALGDKAERCRSLIALGCLGDPRAVEPVKRALFDPSLEVRTVALQVLTDWTATSATSSMLPEGSASALTDALDGALEDPDKSPVFIAWLADGLPVIVDFAAKRERRVLVLLQRAMKDAEEPQLARRIVLALGQLHSPEATSLLRSYARHPKQVVRLAVIAVLKLQEGPGPETLLSDMAATDQDETVKLRARLELLYRKSAIPLQDRTVTSGNAHSVDANAGLSWNPEQNASLQALDQERELQPDEAALSPHLLEKLTSREAEVRLAAVRALAPIQDANVSRALLTALNDKVAAIRQAALEALASRPEPIVQSRLIEALEDDQPEVRRMAVQVLSAHPDGQVTEALVRAFKDHDPSVRLAVVAELASRSGANVKGILLAALDDKVTDVQIKAVDGLALQPGTDVTRALMTTLLKSDSIRRRASSNNLNRIAADALVRRAKQEADESIRSDLGDDTYATVMSSLLPLMTTSSYYERVHAIEAAETLLAAALETGLDETPLLQILINALNDPTEYVGSAAAQALTLAPMARISLSLVAALPLPVPAISPAMMQVLGRCGDPNTLPWIIHTIMDGTASGRLEAVRTVGTIGDIRAFGTLLSALRDEEVTDTFRNDIAKSLSLLGPLSWPLLRPLLAGRRVPPIVISAAALALSISGDPDVNTAAILLDLLGHSSGHVRAAAAQALQYLGERAVLALSLPFEVTTPEGKMYSHLLLSVLEGEPVPQSQDLVAEVTLTEPAEQLPIDDERMTIAGHLAVLGRLVFVAGLAAIGAGCIGYLLAPFSYVWIADLIYRIPPASLSEYLPPMPFSLDIIAILFATWLGTPVLFYQLWRFAAPGLTTREQRVGQRASLGLIGALLLTPFVAVVVAWVIRLVTAQAGYSRLDAPMLIWTTNRLVMLFLVLIFWLVCFQPIWTWLGLQSRATYVLQLAASAPIRRPMATLDAYRPYLLVTVVLSLLTFALIPAYLVASLLLGVVATVLLLSLSFVTVAYFDTTSRQASAKQTQSSGHRSHFTTGLLAGLVPIIEFFVIAPIVFLSSPLWQYAAASALCRFTIGSATPSAICAGIDERTAAWSFFTLSFWAALALSSAFAFLTTCLLALRATVVGSSASARVVSRALGTLAALVLIVSPIFLSGFYWRILSSLAPTTDWLPSTRIWFSIHMALATVAGIATILMLRGVTQLMRSPSPIELAVLLCLVFVLSFAPVTVLAGVLAWPLVIVALSTPIFIGVFVRNGWAQTIATFLAFLRNSERAYGEMFSR